MATKTSPSRRSGGSGSRSRPSKKAAPRSRSRTANKKKPPKTPAISAQVTLGKTDDGGFGLAVELHGHVDGVSREDTKALMEAAHQVCPYSRATRGNIQVTLFAE